MLFFLSPTHHPFLGSYESVSLPCRVLRETRLSARDGRRGAEQVAAFAGCHFDAHECVLREGKLREIDLRACSINQGLTGWRWFIEFMIMFCFVNSNILA